MLFVLAITFYALARLVISNLRVSQGIDIEMVNALASAALILLALYLVLTAVMKLRREERDNALRTGDYFLRAGAARHLQSPRLARD